MFFFCWAVDGGFGPWLEFGECSVTCGNGEQKRERRCDSPEPQHGGKPCEGPNEETRSCEQGPCPGELHFSPCCYQKRAKLNSKEPAPAVNSCFGLVGSHQRGIAMITIS